MRTARLWVRRWGRWLCGGAAAVLLFLQLAVAAHACPGLAPQQGRAMSDCHAAATLDDAAPQLCHAHCGGAHQQQPQQASTPPALDAPLLWLAYLLPAQLPALARSDSRPAAGHPPGAGRIPLYLQLRVLRH